MSNLTIPLHIRAETSPADPNNIRFVLERDVQKGSLLTFPDADTAQGETLVKALFAITGVKMVDVSGAIPDDVIMVKDGKFLILLDYLAPHLGMDTETLRVSLQSGGVVSQCEAEIGIDVGKTRLIIRSSNCVWACQISADGTAYEIPAPLLTTKDVKDGSVLRDRIRQYLSNLPAAKIPITYGQLARSMGLNPPGTIAKVTQALEETMLEDAKNGVPFLASLVVSKVGQSNAAKGFFQQARALGREPRFGENDQDYYQREFNGALAIVTAITHAADSRQD